MLKNICRYLFFGQNSLLSIAKISCIAERGNAHRAAISRIKRSRYVRQYFVTLLQPDGSTLLIRATEPVHLIQVPFNLDVLTDEERRQLEMKRHKTDKRVEKRNEVKFNSDEYVAFWKNAERRKR